VLQINTIMSVVKVIKVLSDSKVIWEDAAHQAVAKASKTLHNIKFIYINDHQRAAVANGKILSYRVASTQGFVLHLLEEHLN
jgi:dodecin